MRSVFVLVASLALCLAAPEGHRIRKDIYANNKLQLGGRIVGGEVANIADVPYQVAILRDFTQICGGSIVAAKTVLTAAHCVVPSVISNLAQLAIRAGSARNDTGGTVIQANGLVIHEAYDDCCMEPKYDIAVVFLTDSAIGAGGVASVIPLANSVFPTGTYGVVSGWGTTTEFGLGSFQLRRVDVPVFDEVECRHIYGSIIDTTAVCAGYQNGGKDACTGDSGGPYAVYGQLLGVVSWGNGCARPRSPGVYTSVPGLRDWIRNNAGI